jgi:hypothetical protein
MTLGAEYHGFPMTLDHLAFPCSLSFEVSQFPDVVDFYLSLSSLTPFALVCKQALSQLGSISVHPGIGFEIKLPSCAYSLFELSSRGEQLIFFGRFPFLLQSKYLSSWSSLQAFCYFLHATVPFSCQGAEETTRGEPEHFVCYLNKIVCEGVVPQKSSDFCVVDHEDFQFTQSE